LKSRIYTWTTLVYSTVALKKYIKCVCRKNMMMPYSRHVTDTNESHYGRDGTGQPQVELFNMELHLTNITNRHDRDA
jgi:hypothetical protein